MKLLLERVLLWTGVATAAGLWPAVGEAQFTHPRPMQRASDEYFALLLNRDFVRLERIAD